MARFSSHDTQRLTRASFEPIAVQRLRNRLPAIVVSLALILLGGAGFRYVGEQLAPAMRMAELERQNAGLNGEIDQTRMELEMERATRSELQRQLDATSAQVTELSHQIEFMSSRGAQARRAN
jgi:hypothetical protein